MRWVWWLGFGVIGAGGVYLAWRSIAAAQASVPAGGGVPVSSSVFPPVAPSGAALDAISGQGVRSVSPAGIVAIQGHEGLNLTAYPDAGGYSIGYGHFGASAGETISQSQADDFFAADLQNVEAAINDHVTVPLDQGQYDALADFVFNVGAGAFAGSTLLRLLNSGDYAGAAGQFQAWKYSGGQVVASLVARRTDETQEFDG